MFPGSKVGKEFKFPIGNMFWAKVDAVYQAFRHKFVTMLDKNEAEISNITAYGNEILWLYIVKKNGYFYKTIFNSI